MHFGVINCHVPFGVTVTLASDIISEIIVSRAYHLYH